MSTKSPSRLEQFSEGKSAYELVLGAMLGSYLGLTISQSGLSGGTYFDLGLLLISITMFVLMINMAGERFHRANWVFASLYSFGSLIFLCLSYNASIPFDVDENIILTICLVWALLMAVESLTMVPGHIKDHRE